jgi:peptidoglycan-associated lipoprotein
MIKKISLLMALAALTACGTTIREPEQLTGKQVYFDFDSAVITEDAENNLLGQSLYMKNHPDATALIAGNCDERGTTEYNLALGSVRATNAAHVLIRDGIESERIKTISYGKEKPLYTGTGEEVWAKNRNATTQEM